MDWQFLYTAPIPVWILLLFVAAAVFIQVFGLVCMFGFRLQKIRTLDTSSPLPGVSIIKPCFNNQDNEIENFDHFFNQDYPGPIQLLFVVADDKDPIVPTIQTYLKRYPKFDAQLVVSKSRIAHWNKVNSLYDAQQVAKHEVVIWSDSDVVVKPVYVTQMVASLQEPGVSVVTTPQYDYRANNFATALKVLANNADDATFMMAYNALNRNKNIALGHSIGFKQSDLNEFREEFWEMMKVFFADDLALPYVFNRNGKKVVFRNIFCPVQYSDKKISQVLDQKRRWVMCQKKVMANPVFYLMGMLFYPEVPSLFLVMIDPQQSFYWGLLAGTAVLRILISALFELTFLGSLRMSLRYFWTVPIWDLMQISFFIDGFVRNRVTLNGQEFFIRDRYFLEPARKPSFISKIHKFREKFSS